MSTCFPVVSYKIMSIRFYSLGAIFLSVVQVVALLDFCAIITDLVRYFCVLHWLNVTSKFDVMVCTREE